MSRGWLRGIRHTYGIQPDTNLKVSNGIASPSPRMDTTAHHTDQSLLPGCQLVHVLSLTGSGITKSVWRLATVWAVRESNPCGGVFFRTRPDRPKGQPSLL
jgi:hypothetical protein